MQVTLLEASDRAGGVLETIYDAGYVIERSADNFATLVPDALQFCRDTGFESQLIRPQEKDRKRSCSIAVASFRSRSIQSDAAHAHRFDAAHPDAFACRQIASGS